MIVQHLPQQQIWLYEALLDKTFNEAKAILPLLGDLSALTAAYFNLPRTSYGDIQMENIIFQLEKSNRWSRKQYIEKRILKFSF